MPKPVYNISYIITMYQNSYLFKWLGYLNYRTIFDCYFFGIKNLTYLSKKALVQEMSQNLRPTQHGIQSCSLHKLKENLLHKNNIDTRIITLLNRGMISFRFRLAMRSFFIYIYYARSQHISFPFSVLFAI